MHQLGVSLLTGKGEVQSELEAVRWFRAASDKGFADSTYNLALLYEEGRGVPQSRIQAHVYYTRAAEQGNWEALHAISIMLAEGVLGEKDLVGAYAWSSLAVVRLGGEGRLKAQKVRDLLSSRLNAQELRQGQQMAVDLDLKYPLRASR